jgi:hypothetical protein
MLEFRDLDDRTRQLMLAEVEHDIANDLYLSSYFNEQGRDLWPTLLRAAVETGSDVSLAQAIRANGCLKAQTTRNLKSGPIYVDVPHNAHETIAESNFSRFYIRALCVRAIEDGHGRIIGYRAKQVMEPRAGSDEMIGQNFDAAEVLADVRATMATAPKLKMPPGPNSGILAHLP